MLSSNYLKKIEKKAVEIYRKLELQIIEEIAERIEKVGYANTVVINNAKIAQEMGVLYKDIIKMVASYNNKSYDEIKKIFEQAGIKTLKNDDKIYKKAGLNPISIKQNKSMLQILLANIKKTHGNLSNLCLTTANTAQKQFYDIINQLHMEVITGVKSYSNAINNKMKNLNNQGIYVTYPSGHRMNLESAAKMNILTSVNQTCGKLQLMRAEELGWDLMEITAHSGARPQHKIWQGKIVSLSGKSEYLSLDDIGYGTITGFKGVNCRHDWMPYYEGSTRTYNDDELDDLIISTNDDKNDIIIKEKRNNYNVYSITQQQIDNICNNELKNINFVCKPKYNPRIKDNGRTKYIDYPWGECKEIIAIEIGKQSKNTKEFLIDTLLHEKLEAKIVFINTNKYRKIKLMNDIERHKYINKVITKYFNMKGWNNGNR